MGAKFDALSASEILRQQYSQSKIDTLLYGMSGLSYLFAVCPHGEHPRECREDECIVEWVMES